MLLPNQQAVDSWNIYTLVRRGIPSSFLLPFLTITEHPNVRAFNLHPGIVPNGVQFAMLSGANVDTGMSKLIS